MAIFKNIEDIDTKNILILPNNYDELPANGTRFTGDWRKNFVQTTTLTAAERMLKELQAPEKGFNHITVMAPLAVQDPHDKGFRVLGHFCWDGKEWGECKTDE